MEKRGVSLAELQEMPNESLVLVAGPPGAGKSTFCRGAVLNSIAADRPVIFVTTEQSPLAVMSLLKEKGIGEPAPEVLSFVDAFSQTVGVETPDRTDTICANCMDLNSLSIATIKLHEKTGSHGALLVFDSLTSPYLFSGIEIVKFMRLFLCKFVAQGNSVLAAVDEGCGQQEDLGAMMSVADGIIRMEIQEGSRIINVVKHPVATPTTIEVPVEPGRVALKSTGHFDPGVMRQFVRSMLGPDEAGAEALRGTLRGIPLFSSVSADDLSNLSRQLTRRHYRKGEIIFHKGDSGSTLHIIDSGSVAVSIPSREAEDVFLARLGPGDFFGELALLDEHPRSATATAVEATETLALEREGFLEFLRCYPDVAIRMLGVLSQRLRNLNAQVESIIRYRPQARLAETLLKLVESHGSETPDGWEISIPLDSAGLAGMVGASTATVRRLLHDLQADGVIGTRKQHYLVHKPEELQRRTPRREA